MAWWRHARRRRGGGPAACRRRPCFSDAGQTFGGPAFAGEGKRVFHEGPSILQGDECVLIYRATFATACSGGFDSPMQLRSEFTKVSFAPMARAVGCVPPSEPARCGFSGPRPHRDRDRHASDPVTLQGSRSEPVGSVEERGFRGQRTACGVPRRVGPRGRAWAAKMASCPDTGQRLKAF